MIRAMIVDDEPFARDDLRFLLGAWDDIAVTGEAGTLEEARTLLREKAVDLVFLDIQLRGGTGFDLAPDIPVDAGIVFITAHDRHAVRAFEINALDYILKPVAPKRLRAAVNRAIRAMRAGKNLADEKGPGEHATSRDPLRPEDRLLLRTDTSRRFVVASDIIAVTSIGGNYTRVHLREKKTLIVRKTLKQWEALLPQTHYIRIHRSHIVSIPRIRSLDKETHKLSVRIVGIDEVFPVSRNNRSGVQHLFDQHGLGVTARR